MSGNNESLAPLLLDADQAALLLNIGRSLFYSMHSAGTLGPLPVRLGRRTLWRREELKRWVAAGCPTRDQWVKIKQN